MLRKFIYLSITIWLTIPIEIYAASNSSSSADGSLLYLRSTVEKVLETNPEYQSATANVESVKAELSGANLPIYNPQLGIELESANEDTYTLGWAQSLDWHDKQNAQLGIQQIALQIAETDRIQVAMSLANNVLNTMTDYFNASEIMLLHKRRAGLLKEIVGLAETRLQAGDINKSEVLLARLALADAVIESASQSTEVIQAKETFFSLSQMTIDDKVNFRIPLTEKIAGNVDFIQYASQHPRERIALLEIERSKREVISKKRERKSDPELGLTVGKEGDESLVGLQFSMPWKIRNNLSYTVDVAQKAQLQIELQAQNTHRSILADIRASKSKYQLNANAWKIWLSNGESQLKEHIELLEQLWKSGELSTTDYLVQLERNLHTQIAGVELKGNMWRAWFQWINATGQVLSWLSIDKKYDIKGEQQ